MEVMKISATLRHSKEMGGSWKSLEIGAEASVDPREDWQKATATLYGQLAKQFKALWAANGVTAHQGASVVDEQPFRIPGNPNGSQQATEHYCQEHKQAFKAKEGKYGTFYSHKAPDGSWCNEGK